MTSTQKKIMHYHIGRLQDRSRDVRLESIRELQELGDPESLPALKEVFTADADLDVRRAAQAAGLVIYRQSRKRSADN